MILVFQNALELFLIRSQDGQWFRAKGYGGGGNSWVGDITKARIYVNIGYARRQVTFFATNYPQHGVPDIVRINALEGEVIDESKRVEKAVKNKGLKEARANASAKQYKWEQAQAELRAAQEKVNSLKRAK